MVLVTHRGPQRRAQDDHDCGARAQAVDRVVASGHDRWGARGRRAAAGGL